MHILQWIASPMKNGISTRIHSYNGGYIIFQSLKQVKINKVRISRSKTNVRQTIWQFLHVPCSHNFLNI